MRSRTPTVHCDGEDGFCGAWDVDHWETSASTVGGVRITQRTPAPGWTTTNSGDDLCPACSLNEVPVDA